MSADSEGFDPEWGTRRNAQKLLTAITDVWDRVHVVLGRVPKRPILEVLQRDPTKRIKAELTERDWHLIRFALERAGESI